MVPFSQKCWSQVEYESPEIVDIIINGNKHLTNNELLSQIHLKEKRLFSKGSFFNRHHLNREEKKLVTYYTLHGFLDVVITDSISIGDNNDARIIINIVEGKEYYLRDISISGNTVYSDAEYLEFIEFRGGSKFNTFKIRENLISVLALYRSMGYPLINIQDSVVVADSVSLFINVNEGPKLNIGKINLGNYEHIPAGIIHREIIVSSGELFNSTNIEESKRRLYETSLFNSVNIRMGTVDIDAATIDLDVDVIPAKFRAFDMNMGIKQGYAEEAINSDPVLSIGLSGSWYHNNIFDTARRIRIETKISSIYPAIFIPQQFKLDLFYIEPWLASFRVPLTINPFYWYIDNTHTNFKNLAYGLRAITTYRWFRKIKVQSLAEWSRSNSNIDSLGIPTETVDLYQEARKIGVKFTWDERDDFFYPHHGFKLVLEPGLVGYFLGGENNYMQIQSSFSTYWNLFGDFVFAHNVNLGMAVQQNSEVDIPYAQRFFLGGNSSIRGFDQQMVGPQSAEGIPLGGNFRFFTNFELRYPIYGYLGGSVFLDMGNLWPTVKDASISDLETAVGLGITIQTPIGPARIDYGIPLGTEPVNKNGQLHIAIAYAF
ncbi:MAG: BamA/TamA family outer membrane protein [Candidatus Marinimicrobia bacterium]|nr:BamA/TamA family outer membrane protein [Candidatus Neomarinimicrobiota bacterium]